MKKRSILIIFLAVILCIPVQTSAHHYKGNHNSYCGDGNTRTQTNGQHYYCNGNPEHTHENGICPYANNNVGAQENGQHYYCNGNPEHMHENGVCPYDSVGFNQNEVQTTQVTYLKTLENQEFSELSQQTSTDLFIQRNEEKNNEKIATGIVMSGMIVGVIGGVGYFVWKQAQR